jgi:hypothetical protein
VGLYPSHTVNIIHFSVAGMAYAYAMLSPALRVIGVMQDAWHTRLCGLLARVAHHVRFWCTNRHNQHPVSTSCAAVCDYQLVTSSLQVAGATQIGHVVKCTVGNASRMEG